MPDDFLAEFNPGEQLQLLLKELYPPDSGAKPSFVSRLDDALMTAGDFAELVYNSCINYMVRRLITTAEYLRRRIDKQGLADPDRKLVVELRSFIREETTIPDRKGEKLLVLLLECLRVRNKEPTSKTKKRIRRVARSEGVRCYICGRELDFDQAGSAVVEHIWPSAFGGANEDFNLGVSCSECNNSKASYIDASDFHYEEICLVGSKDDEHFPLELRRDYRVALWAKSHCKCIVCGRPASYLGELELCRRNPNDSWHFINVDAYCGKHACE